LNGAPLGVQIVAIAVGAAVGALLRWAAGVWLNTQWNGFPLGTLLVNCLGGFLVGVALMCFTRSPNELMRLLVVTGFLGGLTTFSAYSVESLILLQRGLWTLAVAHTMAHVLGALAAAALGSAVARSALA
jgi:fluoride exporter